MFGRKKSSVLRLRCDNTKSKVKLAVMTDQRNKYKQHLFHMQSNSRNKSSSNTPNPNMKVLLKNCHIGAPVRRPLLFHNLLVDGLVEFAKMYAD